MDDDCEIVGGGYPVLRMPERVSFRRRGAERDGPCQRRRRVRRHDA